MPFHFSSSTPGVRPVLSFSLPTVKQSEGPPQETLVMKSFAVPLGLPRACTDHAVPFHISMSCRWSATLKLPTLPTAKHSAADGHAMLLRSLGWMWFPSTGTWGIQRRPFQLSARIRSICLWPARPPTAMQAVLLVHDALVSQENDGVAEALAGAAAIPVASASAASAGTTAPATALLLLIR